MKIAYVSSGLNMTFVVNDMEAHKQAGWDVLPLASCKCPSTEKFSEVMTNWSKRAVYRPNWLMQGGALLCQMFVHPFRFLQICRWLVSFALSNLTGFAKALYELPTACSFAMHCRKFGVQHIHVHFASRSLSLGLMIGILIQSPVSCTVHAFDIFIRSSRNLVPKLSRCCFIATISKYTIEYLREHCGDSIAELCRVVHCGIYLDEFKVKQRRLKPGSLLCIANLVPKKGHEVAIRACARLRNEKYDFQFTIVGDGPLKHRLESLIHSLNLDDMVKLLGPMPNDRLLPLLSEAYGFVLPCTIEPGGDRDGIPVAMMEAMACQIPVISTWVSGVPELVHDGVNGLLVHERDSAALADAIKTLLDDPDKTLRFGQAARKHVEKHFNIKKTTAQLRELIQEQNHEQRQGN